MLGLGLATAAAGQGPTLSAGITAQLGSGFQQGFELTDTLARPYEYREHFLDLTAGYGPLTVWANLEFSSPPQIGPHFNGIRKLRLWWEGQRFSLSAGDLHGQFGRGLALNMWESQAIDWDSSLRGIWLNAGPIGPFSAALVTGSATGGRHLLPGPAVDPRRRDFSDKATVTALEVAARDLPGGLSLGGYLVDVQAVNPWFTRRRNVLSGEYEVLDATDVNTSTRTPGLFAEWVGPLFDAFAEVNLRDHTIAGEDSLYSTYLSRWVHHDRQSRGWGAYGSLSVYPGRWGLTLEYKNYLYDASDPDVRSHLPFRLNRRTPVQNPPSAFREHAATLLARQPHIMDFEDEVGVQLELNVALSDDLFLIANYAQSSRHSGFRRVVRAGIPAWEQSDIPSKLWSTDSERFYPFREIYAEVNYHYAPLRLDVKGMASLASEVLSFAETVIEGAGPAFLDKEILNWERRQLVSLPLQVSLSIPGLAGWGLTLDWEHQREAAGFRSRIHFRDAATGRIDSVTFDGLTTQAYSYRYAAVTVGKPSRLSFGIVWDYASQQKAGGVANVDPADDSWLEAAIRSLGVDLRNKWFGLQFTGYLTPSASLSVFYGSLQGGLKCDTGVCVFVPGIEDALTLTFASNF